MPFITLGQSIAQPTERRRWGDVCACNVCVCSMAADATVEWILGDVLPIIWMCYY